MLNISVRMSNISVRIITGPALIALAVFALVSSIVYSIHETERVVITRMGKPVREVVDAGAHLKWPWPIEKVNVQEKRMFIYELEPRPISTKDKKTLIVDLFAFLYITDGVRFLEKVGSLAIAGSRVDTVFFSELLDVIGKHNLSEVIGDKRDIFMEEIKKNGGVRLAEFGLGVATVRANRTDLPQQNKASIYANMSSERMSDATRIRAEGTSEKTRIESEGDREYITIVSTAKATGERMRGEGDAEATKLFNETYSKDPEFFDFYRGMQAAEVIMKDSNAKLILKGDEPHLKHLLK